MNKNKKYVVQESNKNLLLLRSYALPNSAGVMLQQEKQNYIRLIFTNILILRDR